jgi:hypothetical protein
MYENFEDTAPLTESTTEISLTPPTAPPPGAENTEEVKEEVTEEMEDIEEETEEPMENKSEPAPSDIDALSAKFLGTKPKEKTKATKKYRLPSEKADGDHHMDAGSTFMKAYNQLKPEQVKALTTDTQKLISVQKDLMANLNNLKPLVSDGKEIMKTFKSFFGSDPTSS